MTIQQTAIEALMTIARGRRDNGRALSAGQAQAEARKALLEIGLDWTRAKPLGERLGAESRPTEEID